MSSQWTPDREALDRLLAWLDSDRERAGARYEDIRRRLIKLFTCRGCATAEDLADETINRVMRKVKGVAETYSGDPALYFFGVARHVHLEHVRRKPILAPLPSAQEHDENLERAFECLDRCMQGLTKQNRELALQYYSEEKRAKIDSRKELAARLGVALNALRIRAHRIRASLHDCVRQCLHGRAGS